MLLFAFTGITLNHAADIEAEPSVAEIEAIVPGPVLATLAGGDEGDPIPEGFADWADKELSVDLRRREAEWSPAELYVPLPRPGGDGWLAVDRETGDLIYEDSDRGWIAWLNDLHKGRDTGAAWSLFIDGFSIACIIFSVTGFFLLQLHAKNRKSTWPIVGGGVLIPLLLIILFVHS